MAYNFFVDSDIFLDVLVERKPFFNNSYALFTAQFNNQILIYTTASVILNVQYSGDKLVGRTITKYGIKELLTFIKICVTDKSIVAQAYNSSFADVEDAVQYYSAGADNSIDFFVTRNVKNYKYADAHLKIITPAEAIKIFS